MKKQSGRKPKRAAGVRVAMKDRSLDLKIKPLIGHEMTITARIMVNRDHQDVQYRFDGTPVGEFLRTNEMAAWSNALKKLITDARDKLAELRNEAE